MSARVYKHGCNFRWMENKDWVESAPYMLVVSQYQRRCRLWEMAKNTNDDNNNPGERARQGTDTIRSYISLIDANGMIWFVSSID